MDTKTRIGLQIREIRKAKGLTQDQLAGLIERSVEAISNLERGVSLPGIDTLERLSTVLGVPMRDFLDFPEARKISAKRLELLARLNATLHTLPDKQLKLALAQLEAIRDNS